MITLIISTIIITGGSYLGILLIATKYIPYPWYIPVIIAGGFVIAFGWVKIIVILKMDRKG